MDHPASGVLVGYARWGPGQLERELAEGAWLPAVADPDLLFDVEPTELWRRAYVQAIGSSPAAFVTTTRRSA
jgi:putative transcriptional regulator